MNYNLMMVSIFLYRHFILYVRFFIYGPISHGFEGKKNLHGFEGKKNLHGISALAP